MLKLKDGSDGVYVNDAFIVKIAPTPDGSEVTTASPYCAVVYVYDKAEEILAKIEMSDPSFIFDHSRNAAIKYHLLCTRDLVAAERVAAEADVAARGSTCAKAVVEAMDQLTWLDRRIGELK